ncbi:MAG: hypothetical protein AAFU71_00185 [Cyanobacteria bacterium J06632_22]
MQTRHKKQLDRERESKQPNQQIQRTVIPQARPFGDASQVESDAQSSNTLSATFDFSQINILNDSGEAVHQPKLTSVTQPLQRDIDPEAVSSGQTKINPQDIKLEQIGHGLIYHDQLKPSEQEWLLSEGFHPNWYPASDGSVVNAGSGLNYGLLVPNEQGKAAGKVPVLAFRGTNDLATLWQDMDINSPGHGGIQPLLANCSKVAHRVMQEGFSKIDVTGHSLGGALAQHFTGTFPGIVRRLVTFQSAAPNGAQYRDNMESLDEEEMPEIVHHIAKGDVVDLAGGEHLEGSFFEHNLEEEGLASVSTLARIKQAHTAKLLNTEDIVGDETLASGKQAQGKHKSDIKEYQGSRPYGVKSRLTEAGRMGALNKAVGIPMGIGVGLAGAALTVPEVAVRGTVKGLKAGGKALGKGLMAGGKAVGKGLKAGGKAVLKGAKSLAKTVRNTFKGDDED